MPPPLSSRTVTGSDPRTPGPRAPTLLGRPVQSPSQQSWRPDRSACLSSHQHYQLTTPLLRHQKHNLFNLGGNQIWKIPAIVARGSILLRAEKKITFTLCCLLDKELVDISMFYHLIMQAPPTQACTSTTYGIEKKFCLFFIRKKDRQNTLPLLSGFLSFKAYILFL